MYLLEVDRDAARKVGEGSVIGVGERRVVTLFRERGSPTKLNIYELGGDSGVTLLNSIELPDGGFGQKFRAKMLGRDKVLLESTRGSSGALS